MRNFFNRSEEANFNAGAPSDHDLLKAWSNVNAEEERPQKTENEQAETDPAFRKFQQVKNSKLAKLKALKAKHKQTQDVQDIAEKRSERMLRGISELEAIKAKTKEVETHLAEQVALTGKAVKRNANIECAFLQYLEDDSMFDAVLAEVNEEHANHVAQMEAKASNEQPVVEVNPDAQRYALYFIDEDMTVENTQDELELELDEEEVPASNSPLQQEELELKDYIACPNCGTGNEVHQDRCSLCYEELRPDMANSQNTQTPSPVEPQISTGDPITLEEEEGYVPQNSFYRRYRGMDNNNPMGNFTQVPVTPDETADEELEEMDDYYEEPGLFGKVLNHIRR